MPFPSPRGNRIAYDRDGTAVLIRRDSTVGGAWVSVHPEAVRAMNSSTGAGMIVELNDSAFWIWSHTRSKDPAGLLAFTFPLPLNLEGAYVSAARYRESYADWASLPVTAEVSPDTTNGVDGEWTTLTDTFQGNPLVLSTAPESQVGAEVRTGSLRVVPQVPAKEVYRQRVVLSGVGQQDPGIRGVRGLRLSVPSPWNVSDEEPNPVDLLTVHLYGSPAVVSAPALGVWHPSADLRVTPDYLQWGDTARPSSGSRQFRIKNLSDTATAQSVVLAFSDEWRAPAPTPAGQFQLSLDGLNWVSTLTLTSIPSSSFSPVVTVRRTTTGDAPLGSHSPRLDLTVGGWSG